MAENMLPADTHQRPEPSTAKMGLSKRRVILDGIACERCRSLKLRCDRAQPCSRCHKTTSSCVYRERSRRNDRKALSQPRPIAQKDARTHDIESEALKAPRIPHRVSAGFQHAKTGGFRGNTAGLAVFEDAQAQLPVRGWQEVELAEVEPATEPHKGVTELGASLLALFPPRENSDKLMASFYRNDFCGNKMEQTVRAFHEGLWSEFEQDMQSHSGRMKVAGIITSNMRKPIPVPKTNAEWLDSVSGPKTRWEMIGYLLVVYANMAMDLSKDQAVAHGLMSQSETVSQHAIDMLNAADSCLELCQGFDPAANLLYLQLMTRTLTFQSVICGDSSHDLWRRTGLLVNAATAIGLHRALEHTQVAPLFHQGWSEIAWSIFEFDKTLATFTGRPPSLSRRYMSVPWPLDVPSHILAAASSLADLQPHLDANGFSLSGTITPATTSRVKCAEAMIRDEILEFALCTRQPPDIGDHIERLRRQRDEYWSQHPPFFHQPIKKETFVDMQQYSLSALSHTRFNYLHNCFLIERISEQHGDRGMLLKAAFELVDGCVVVWNERERFFAMRDLCHWYISYYGIPAASALALELLKSKGGGSTTHLPAQRGQITQLLTLFIGCLNWVVPTDGNYTLCGQVKTLIQRILDDVLASLFDGPSRADGFDLSQFDVSNIPIFGADFDNWFDTDINLDWPTGFFQ